MAHAVRGLLLLPVYSGGFSAVCPIRHFNAPVRRFNVRGYPYTSAAPLALWPLFMALWRGVVPCPVAYRLRCQLAAVLIPLCPCRRLCPKLIRGLRPFILIKVDMCIHIVPSLLRRCGLGGLRRLLRRAWRSAKVAGKVAKVAGIVAVKVASTCAKVAHLPQNHSRLQNSVYKGGIFVAHFPGINGKSCKSRSVSAHFTSKSLAAMYFCWSCSGVKPSSCGWFGVKTISCLSTMP